MKPRAPDVLRKGAIIRVGGSDASAPAPPLSYVDLRFYDGHVERWLGSGETRKLPEHDDGVRALVAWGEEVIEVQAECLIEELAMDFSDVPAELPGAVEVVIEWNAKLHLTPGNAGSGAPFE